MAIVYCLFAVSWTQSDQHELAAWMETFHIWRTSSEETMWAYLWIHPCKSLCLSLHLSNTKLSVFIIPSPFLWLYSITHFTYCRFMDRFHYPTVCRNMTHFFPSTWCLTSLWILTYLQPWFNLFYVVLTILSESKTNRT